MSNIYVKGETAVIQVKIYDTATGVPVDPTTVKISVYDAGDVVKVNNQDMVKDATGEYHYDVDTSGFDNLGVCLATITATTGARSAIEKTYFILYPLV